jgi:hypothetical protein
VDPLLKRHGRLSLDIIRAERWSHISGYGLGGGVVMTEQTAQPQGQGHGHGHDEVTIHIDHSTFKVEVGSMSGQELRQLPSPAIGPEFDLWEDVPGGEDIRIADSATVELRNGMHFFTTPGRINPGGDSPAARTR